jgi:uncharacterized protein (DUF305 family)
MELSGDTDKDFARAMATHHKMGIKLAMVETEHGKNQELKGMAQKIIDTMTSELKMLGEYTTEDTMKKNR